VRGDEQHGRARRKEHDGKRREGGRSGGERRSRGQQLRPPSCTTSPGHDRCAGGRAKHGLSAAGRLSRSIESEQAWSMLRPQHSVRTARQHLGPAADGPAASTQDTRRTPADAASQHHFSLQLSHSPDQTKRECAERRRRRRRSDAAAAATRRSRAEPGTQEARARREMERRHAGAGRGKELRRRREPKSSESNDGEAGGGCVGGKARCWSGPLSLRVRLLCSGRAAEELDESGVKGCRAELRQRQESSTL
jgi:hypothetical protein